MWLDDLLMLLNSIFSPTGNHTIAVVKVSEEHQTLKESLANVIYDVNSLVKEKEIKIDGQTIGLDFFLGEIKRTNQETY